MDTAEFTLSEHELRVLMHLVDSMTTTVACGFGMSQIDVSELYLKLSDGHSELEDRRIAKSNHERNQ